MANASLAFTTFSCIICTVYILPGVARWPTAGNTVGYSLHQLSSSSEYLTTVITNNKLVWSQGGLLGLFTATSFRPCAAGKFSMLWAEFFFFLGGGASTDSVNLWLYISFMCASSNWYTVFSASFSLRPILCCILLLKFAVTSANSGNWATSGLVFRYREYLHIPGNPTPSLQPVSR